MTTNPSTADHERKIAEVLTSEKTTNYFRSLGEFMTIFSSVEVNLQMAVWEFAGLSEPVAKAILPSLRIEMAMSTINRIADTQSWNAEKRAELEDMFWHLGEINKLRNDILHYGAAMDGSEWITVTNKAFAHVPNKVRTLRISSTTLKEATLDLVKIQTHLVALAWGHRMPLTARASMSDILTSAWRYKSPQQAGDPRKSQKTPQARKRPRRPSRGKPNHNSARHRPTP
jgi:hypothetical protein